MFKRLAAEGLGTLFLTAAICLAAVATGRSAGQAHAALVLSLTAGAVLAGSYVAFAQISGGHFNPAVSIGSWLSGRTPAKDTVLHMLAQTLGAALGGLAAFLVLTQQPGFQPLDFSANGYGAHSPEKFTAPGVFAAEALLTLLFVWACLRVPDAQRALVLGLLFAGCCLAAFGISGAGLNPSRSTGAALFAEGWAIDQLWLFWLAPLVGGAGAGLLDKWLFRHSGD